MNVSIVKICLDTPIIKKSNMGQREYHISTNMLFLKWGIPASASKGCTQPFYFNKTFIRVLQDYTSICLKPPTLRQIAIPTRNEGDGHG
jgi:hypothetical protein